MTNNTPTTSAVPTTPTPPNLSSHLARNGYPWGRSWDRGHPARKGCPLRASYPICRKYFVLNRQTPVSRPPTPVFVGSTVQLFYSHLSRRSRPHLLLKKTVMILLFLTIFPRTNCRSLIARGPQPAPSNPCILWLNPCLLLSHGWRNPDALGKKPS